MPPFPTFRLCLAVLLALGLALWVRDWVLDDSFIFFRYAENWVGGHGPVFNAGEAPVEGYTSFLWLSLLSLCHLAGMELLTASLVLGYLCAAVTLLLLALAPRLVPGIRPEVGGLSCLLLATCGAFVPWAQSGMETSLHALLLCSLVLVHLRAVAEPGRLGWSLAEGLLMALLAMNRPDGLLAVAVLGLHRLAGLGRGVLGVALLSLCFLLLFGGYFAWRYDYYGYLFPNTFYVKVGSGWAQVWRGLSYLGQAALLLAPLLLLAARGLIGRGSGRMPVILGALLLAYLAYIAAVGGDVMPAYRFLTPLTPLFCLSASQGCLGSAVPRMRNACAGLTMAWGLSGYLVFVVPIIDADVVAHNGRMVGSWMRENLPAGTRIAVNTAGSVAFYSKLPAIDMLGLNDAHIGHRQIPGLGSGHAGHEKGDGAYVMEQRPAVVQLGSSLGWHPDLGAPPPFLGDRELWADPRFLQRYTFLWRKAPTIWPDRRPLGSFGLWVDKRLFAELGGNPK